MQQKRINGSYCGFKKQNIPGTDSLMLKIQEIERQKTDLLNKNMDNTKNNSPVTIQNDQDLQKQLDALLKDAKKIDLEINETNKEVEETINDVEQNIDETAQKIEKTISELDAVEKETNNKLDNLILKQSENLGTQDLDSKNE